MFCFQTCDIPAAENLGLYTYEFNDLPMSEDETLKSTIAMFRDSNIIKKFRIPYDVSEVLSTALCIMQWWGIPSHHQENPRVDWGIEKISQRLLPVNP